MAEFLPLHAPGRAFTRTASATITAGQLLIVSGSGTVAPCSAASASFIGTASKDAVTGDALTVFAGGVHKLVATGSITAGATVECATAGTVATHTNGTNDVNIVGLALTTVTTGQLVEIQMER